METLSEYFGYRRVFDSNGSLGSNISPAATQRDSESTAFDFRPASFVTPV
jgi:hypothetical protein